MDWPQSGMGLSSRICIRLAYYPRIGIGLADLWRIGILVHDWHMTGGLALDWQIMDLHSIGGFADWIGGLAKYWRFGNWLVRGWYWIGTLVKDWWKIGRMALADSSSDETSGLSSQWTCSPVSYGIVYLDWPVVDISFATDWHDLCQSAACCCQSRLDYYMWLSVW